VLDPFSLIVVVVVVVVVVVAAAAAAALRLLLLRSVCPFGAFCFPFFGRCFGGADTLLADVR